MAKGEKKNECLTWTLKILSVNFDEDTPLWFRLYSEEKEPRVLCNFFAEDVLGILTGNIDAKDEDYSKKIAEINTIYKKIKNENIISTTIRLEALESDDILKVIKAFSNLTKKKEDKPNREKAIDLLKKQLKAYYEDCSRQNGLKIWNLLKDEGFSGKIPDTFEKLVGTLGSQKRKPSSTETPERKEKSEREETDNNRKKENTTGDNVNKYVPYFIPIFIVFFLTWINAFFYAYGFTFPLLILSVLGGTVYYEKNKNKDKNNAVLFCGIIIGYPLLSIFVRVHVARLVYFAIPVLVLNIFLWLKKTKAKSDINLRSVATVAMLLMICIGAKIGDGLYVAPGLDDSEEIQQTPIIEEGQSWSEKQPGITKDVTETPDESNQNSQGSDDSKVTGEKQVQPDEVLKEEQGGQQMESDTDKNETDQNSNPAVISERLSGATASSGGEAPDSVEQPELQKESDTTDKSEPAQSPKAPATSTEGASTTGATTPDAPIPSSSGSGTSDPDSVTLSETLSGIPASLGNDAPEETGGTQVQSEEATSTQATNEPDVPLNNPEITQTSPNNDGGKKAGASGSDRNIKLPVSEPNAQAPIIVSSIQPETKLSRANTPIKEDDTSPDGKPETQDSTNSPRASEEDRLGLRESDPNSINMAGLDEAIKDASTKKKVVQIKVTGALKDSLKNSIAGANKALETDNVSQIEGVVMKCYEDVQCVQEKIAKELDLYQCEGGYTDQAIDKLVDFCKMSNQLVQMDLKDPEKYELSRTVQACHSEASKLDDLVVFYALNNADPWIKSDVNNLYPVADDIQKSFTKERRKLIKKARLQRIHTESGYGEYVVTCNAILDACEQWFSNHRTALSDEFLSRVCQTLTGEQLQGKEKKGKLPRIVDQKFN